MALEVRPSGQRDWGKIVSDAITSGIGGYQQGLSLRAAREQMEFQQTARALELQKQQQIIDANIAKENERMQQQEWAQNILDGFDAADRQYRLDIAPVESAPATVGALPALRPRTEQEIAAAGQRRQEREMQALRPFSFSYGGMDFQSRAEYDALRALAEQRRTPRGRTELLMSEEDYNARVADGRIDPSQVSRVELGNGQVRVTLNPQGADRNNITRQRNQDAATLAQNKAITEQLNMLRTGKIDSIDPNVIYMMRQNPGRWGAWLNADGTPNLRAIVENATEWNAANIGDDIGEMNDLRRYAEQNNPVLFALIKDANLSNLTDEQALAFGRLKTYRDRHMQLQEDLRPIWNGVYDRIMKAQGSMTDTSLATIIAGTDISIDEARIINDLAKTFTSDRNNEAMEEYRQKAAIALQNQREITTLRNTLGAARDAARAARQQATGGRAAGATSATRVNNAQIPAEFDALADSAIELVDGFYNTVSQVIQYKKNNPAAQLQPSQQQVLDAWQKMGASRQQDIIRVAEKIRNNATLSREEYNTLSAAYQAMTDSVSRHAAFLMADQWPSLPALPGVEQAAGAAPMSGAPPAPPAAPAAPPQAQAQPQAAPRRGRVATQSSPLQVRESPNGRVIGTLPKDREVTVIDAGDGWSIINYGGRQAYVATRYVR